MDKGWIGKLIRYNGRRYTIIDVIQSCYRKAIFIAEDVKTKAVIRITREI